MMFDLVTNITMSIIVIAILHSFYNYIKDVYTTKRQRDIGRIHQEKFQDILEQLKKEDPIQEFLPTHDIEVLQNSLFDYVQTMT